MKTNGCFKFVEFKLFKPFLPCLTLDFDKDAQNYANRRCKRHISHCFRLKKEMQKRRNYLIKERWKNLDKKIIIDFLKEKRALSKKQSKKKWNSYCVRIHLAFERAKGCFHWLKKILRFFGDLYRREWISKSERELEYTLTQRKDTPK